MDLEKTGKIIQIISFALGVPGVLVSLYLNYQNNTRPHLDLKIETTAASDCIFFVDVIARNEGTRPIKLTQVVAVTYSAVDLSEQIHVESYAEALGTLTSKSGLRIPITVNLREKTLPNSLRFQGIVWSNLSEPSGRTLQWSKSAEVSDAQNC